MIRVVSASPGICVASLLAGPVFVTSAAAAFCYAQLPAAIPVSGDSLTGFAIIGLLSVPFGFFLAILPNAIGTCLLALIGERLPVVRTRLTWPIVGGATGILLAHLVVGDEPQSAWHFAWVATSLICAAICHRSVRWVDEPRCDMR